jgi:hypothetical protein
LVGGLCGFSFWCANRYRKMFAIIKANWQVSFLSPLFSLTYLYHWSNSLHRLLNIMCPIYLFPLFSFHQCYNILVAKILNLFLLIIDIYNGRISNKVWHTQTLCIP